MGKGKAKTRKAEVMSSKVTVTGITLKRRQAWVAMLSAIGIQLNLALTNSTGAEQAIHTLSRKAIDQTECSIKKLKCVKWMINSQKLKRSSWKKLSKGQKQQSG